MGQSMSLLLVQEEKMKVEEETKKVQEAKLHDEKTLQLLSLLLGQEEKMTVKEEKKKVQQEKMKVDEENKKNTNPESIAAGINKAPEAIATKRTCFEGCFCVCLWKCNNNK